MKIQEIVGLFGGGFAFGTATALFVTSGIKDNDFALGMLLGAVVLMIAFLIFIGYHSLMAGQVIEIQRSDNLRPGESEEEGGWDEAYGESVRVVGSR